MFDGSTDKPITVDLHYSSQQVRNRFQMLHHIGTSHYAVVNLFLLFWFFYPVQKLFAFRREASVCFGQPNAYG